MGSLTFALLGHPPLPNATMSWHWAKRGKEAKVWRDAAAWGAKGAYRDSTLSGDPVPVSIHVKFSYRRRRTRDMANLVASLKPIIDGLVDARVLPDDSPRWLPAPPTVAQVVDPKGFDGITITVTEIEP